MPASVLSYIGVSWKPERSVQGVRLGHELHGLQTRDLVADRARVGQQPFQDRPHDSLATGLWT